MPVTPDFGLSQQIELIRGGISRRDDLPRRLYPVVEGAIVGSGGQLLHAEGRPYIWDGVDHIIYEVSPRSERWASFLYGRFRLIPSEQLSRHLTTMLAGHALAHGVEAIARRFTYWDKDELILYVSDYDGHSYRIDGGLEVQRVNNGDAVLFFDDDGGRGVPEPDIGPHGELIPALLGDLGFVGATSGGMTPADQQRLLAMWMHAIAFSELLPAKPILIAEGSPGSGKTAALQRIQYCLHGAHRARTLGKGDEDDFGVTLMRSPLALIDNVDGYIDWLQDALCAYATGAGWSRRKKYSDDQEVVILPRAFLAFASKNPTTFRRDDIADRSLIVRMERRGEFSALSDLLASIDARRPRLFGEWLHNLNLIVRRIREGLPPSPLGYRMADFARLALVIGQALGFAEADTLGTLEAAQGEREAFLWETDVLPDLLGRWLKTDANSAREVRPMDLYRELSELAEKNRVTFYKNWSYLERRMRAGIKGFVLTKVEGADGPAYQISR